MMNGKILVSLLVGIALTLPATAASATELKARLDGFQRVPSISTDARGTFRARLDRRNDELRFRLSYRNVETPVLFAHMHLGRRARNGGIPVWLCDNVDASPTPVPNCPQGSGTVEGTVTADDVVALEEQGIEAGDFDAIVEALLAEAMYVNVHTETFPSGEFRGQIELGFRPFGFGRLR